MPGLDRIWEALRQTGTTRHAQLILKHNACNTESLVGLSRSLIEDGMPKGDLEVILAWLTPAPSKPITGRSDHPVLWQPESLAGSRASFTLALQAAEPNQRKRSLEDLERDVLAQSTRPSQESRVRTFLAICTAWEVVPFPLTPECVKAVGASLKAGRYRSSHLYFQAAINHQIRRYGLTVEPFIRALIKDVNRSVKRGLGPARLKAGFSIFSIAALVDPDDSTAFTFEKVSHMADLIIITSWFMMRELEISSARDSYLSLQGNEVTMMIPLHKTSIQASLTSRTLLCACSVQLSPLCPWHAAERHLVRLHHHGHRRAGAYFPLFPGNDGQTVSKYKMNIHIRAALTTAGVATTQVDANGISHELYGGHSMRVSGAQFLSASGVELALIQLLGRWSSNAIERYTQDAALTIVPQISQQVIRGSDPPQTAIPPRAFSSSEQLTQVANPGSLVPTSGATSSSTKQLDERLIPMQKQLDALKISISSLKAAVRPPDEVLIIRPRRQVVHRGVTDEQANNPQLWRTQCGWSYGVSRFFRIQALVEPFRPCAKCFHDTEAIDSDPDSEGDSSSSGSTGSHSSD